MNSIEFRNKLIESFDNTKISNNEVEKIVNFRIHFVCNPFVEVIGNSDDKFKIEFIDKEEVFYTNILNCGMWCKANRSYFTNWRIRITNLETEKLEYDEYINLKNKRVYISFESKSLGDTLAWLPYVEEFRKKHNCELIVSTFLNELFEENYPEINFIKPGQTAQNIYAQYRIGWFNDGDEYNKNMHPNDFKKIPLQKTASDILGLDYKEIRARVKYVHTKVKNSRVGIAIQSTAQTKYWNNPNGWQEVVDFLKSKGYSVILYSKEPDGYMGNYYPKGVSKFEGTLLEVMNDMSKCDFFIGIGSGLSWLSWTINLPTFIISGFSEEYTETFDNTFRIINKSVCNGCFNSHKFDPGDWNWCPVFKGSERQFECTKQISSEMVINRIEEFLLSEYANIEKVESTFNKFDYVEIGTSDFDTLLESLPHSYRGLSIEPMKYYLDRLPNLANNTKLNLAISNQDKNIDIYYVDPTDIKKYELPDWIKGCNSIGKPHSSVIKYLEDNYLTHIYKRDNITCLSFQSLIKKYNITEIDYLKIDTEGHDFTIIRNLLSTNIRPKKIRFEANSLYTEKEIKEIIEELKLAGYILIQRTFDDIVVRKKSELDEISNQPILVISTGRRLDYLTRTIKSLFDHDKLFNNKVKSVWLLDDRSSEDDRFHIEKLMRSYFGDNWTSVYFNSNEPFKFVEKFRFIKKICNPDDVIFLLEDDWECYGDLSINYHTNNLIRSNWTQIAFADALEIQDIDIQKSSIVNFDYWKNPYPNVFKHVNRWNGDICYWNKGSINNWTNNPSLVKGSVFHKADFKLIKNFEWDFAQQLSGNQVFANECMFRHFGQNSLIDQL